MDANMNGGGLSIGSAGCRGMTLIEVLIALVVLSIGLLGLAGLQTASLKFNTSAFYVTQATTLAYDFADRMRANREAALDGAYAVAFEDPPPACSAAVVGATVAARDISTWRNALACTLPLGTGEVVRNANEFTITVRWDENRGEVLDDGEEPETEFVFTTAL